MTLYPTSRQSLWFGLKLRCPKCGEGKLFSSYLRLYAFCSHCQEPFGAIRADDGPAWLTIMLTGHLILPLVVYLETRHVIDLWIEIGVLLVATLACSLLILPRAKGLFIAILWKSQHQKI